MAGGRRKRSQAQPFDVVEGEKDLRKGKLCLKVYQENPTCWPRMAAD